MKKSLFSLLIIFVAFSTFAQVSFEKKRIVAGLNFDVGIYNTEGWLNDFPTIKETDKAGSTIVSAWGEYGILNWLGAGLKIGRSKYFTEKDSISGVQPDVSSFDIGVQLSAHVVRTKKFDLPITLVFGSSSYNHKSNDANNSTATDLGTFSNFSINPRFFFGSSAKFGMNIKIGWASYAYNSLDFKSNSFNYSDYYTLRGSGGNFLIGFQYNIK